MPGHPNAELLADAILVKELDNAIESIFVAFDASNAIANAIETLEALSFSVPGNTLQAGGLPEGLRQISESLKRRPRPDVTAAISLAMGLVESAKAHGASDAVAQSYFALGICYTALEFQHDSDRQEENQYSAIQCLKEPLQYALNTKNVPAAGAARAWLGEIYLRMPRDSPEEARFHLNYAISYFTAMLDGPPSALTHDDICRSRLGIATAHSLLPAQRLDENLKLVLDECKRASTDARLGARAARLHILKHALIGMQYYRFLMVGDTTALNRSREHLQIVIDNCPRDSFEAFRSQIGSVLGEVCMLQGLWSEACGFFQPGTESLSQGTLDADPFHPGADAESVKNHAFCEAMAGHAQTALQIATSFRARLIKRGFLEQLAAADSSVLDHSSYRKLLIPLRRAQLALAGSRPAAGALIGQIEHEGLPAIQVYEQGQAEGARAPTMAREHLERSDDVRRLTGDFNSAFAQACEKVPTLQRLLNQPENQVATSLETDQALLVPITARTGTVVIIVTRAGVVHVDAPDLTSLNIRMLVGQGRPATRSWNENRQEPMAFGYLGAYHNRRRDRAAWAATLQQVLEILGRVFWEPVLAHLPKGIKRLAIVPDGPMSFLPIHAAYRCDVLDDRRPILADFAVSCTPSVECFCLSKAVAAERHLDSLFCIVNPEEDEALGWTKFEAEAIKMLFPQNTVIAGRRANRALVLSDSKNSSCIHIAAHGFFDWRNVRRSGVRMSDAPITVEDIWLGLWDLTRARLVVLSACETGVIDGLARASSEMPGLPGALHLAGVPAVVGTLWPVDDVAAAIIMTKFYSIHLSEHVDLPTALTRAQDWLRNATLADVESFALARGPALVAKAQELRKDLTRTAAGDDAQPFRDPTFWAPYVCFGS